MKNKATITLDRDQIIILSMGLRSLSTLRLNCDLSFSDNDACKELNDFSIQDANDFRCVCHALDCVIDDPSSIVSRLIEALDLCAEADVLHFLHDELMSILGESDID
jgi:hypothetical protein